MIIADELFAAYNTIIDNVLNQLKSQITEMNILVTGENYKLFLKKLSASMIQRLKST